MTAQTNERVKLVSQMIGIDPKFWPYPIPRNFKMALTEISVGRAVFKVTVKEDWLNPLKILHGGIIVTLMDEAMGMAMYTLNKAHRYATINLNADFFKSVKAGEDIFVIGEVEKDGTQVIHIKAHIQTTEGKIIAKTTSNFVIYSKKA